MPKGDGLTYEQRFRTRYVVDRKTGCWNWTAGLNGKGYAYFWLNGGTRQAYKVAYVWKYGLVPKGLDLDHVCLNKKCVNPDHLEAVTRKEHTHRGSTLAAINFRKTRCLRGHPFTKENTFIKPSGARVCRTCQVILYRKYKKERMRYAV